MNEQAEELAARSTGGRYIELDSLRGLAAVTVIAHHLAEAFRFEPSWLMQPFFAGTQAVMMFFVLSGFVLSLPFWNKGQNGAYGPYIIRRFFRIYVPYLAALLLSVAGALYFRHSTLVLSSWYQLTWHTPITPVLLVRLILMDKTATVNTAFWSLRFEVLMSILFPPILLAVRLLRSPASLLILIAVSIASAIAVHVHPGMLTGSTAIHQLGSFILGAVLAAERERLRLIWQRIPNVGRAMLLCASLYLYFGYAGGFLKPIYLLLPHDPEIFGAAGVLLCAMYSKTLRSILRYRVFEYLGRISYSIYLVHGTVMFAAIDLLYGKIPLSALIMIVLTLSFALAHLFCIGVEEPALRKGKALSMKVGQASR